MQQKMSRIKQVVFVALAIQLAVIILLQLIFKINILPGILVLIAESLIAVYLLDYFQSANEEESIGLEKYFTIYLSTSSWLNLPPLPWTNRIRSIYSSQVIPPLEKPYLYQAEQLPSTDTIQAPTGCSGVQSLPNKGHASG